MLELDVYIGAGQMGNGRDVECLARNLYSKAHVSMSHVMWHRFLAHKSQESQSLLGLDSVERQGRIVMQRYAGTQLVPLWKIRGSEGRQGDFDRDFHPLNWTTDERWKSIARACYLGQGLPPVDLIQVG